MIAVCIQKDCTNKNCAHRGEHTFYDPYCCRKPHPGGVKADCQDSRCAPEGIIVVKDELELL